MIAWGSTRDEAIARLGSALRETVVTGVLTTIPFHLWTLAHPGFRSGHYHTRFVEEEWAAPSRRPDASPGRWLAALAAAALAARDDRRPPLLPPQDAGAWGRAARQDGLA